MTRYGLGMFILRIIVPVLISISIIIRPSFMCLIYMAMLLYLPFINLLDERNIDTGTFKYIMIFLPFQTIATQAGFYLYTLSTDEILLDENADMRRLMKNVGLNAVNSSEPLEMVLWMSSEGIMLVVSILYTWAVKMMASAGAKETMMGAMEIEELITICMLLLSALWKHGIFGLVYLLLFLFFISCWAFNKDLRRLLSIVLFFCIPVAMVHILWMYLYQIEYIQDSISQNTTYNRLFGIDQLVQPFPTYGPDFTIYMFNTNDYINLFYPIIIYVLYYFMVNTALMLKSLDVWSITFVNMMSIWMFIMGIALWMVPNKRKATLICSFPLCIYAYISMTYTYLLGMEDWEVFEIEAMKLGQMSFFQFLTFSRKITLEVAIKLLYTVPFWSTIRHYMEERQRKKAAMESFLRTQSEMIETERSLRSSSILETILKRFFVKYWLGVMALFLYADAVTDADVGVLMIIEIFQCFLFLLILQLSFKAWRKLLYFFMIFLIFMSLLPMSLFYSYQFQATHYFIEETLKIPRNLKEDLLGVSAEYTLINYINAIVVPTIFIAFTLLQMTFFHKPFMEMSDENNTKVAEMDDENKGYYGRYMRIWTKFRDISFLIMEQHLMKLVILLIFFMCIMDVCAINFIILVPMCITMVTKHPEVKEIRRNSAEWLGFSKIDTSESSLFMHLLWQTLFVAVSAFKNIVHARQRIVRKQHGLDPKKPAVMFPEVTFREADFNLTTFTKYVLNYGYYRLGYEITLICLVVVISIRLDGFAIMYAGWLCVLLVLPRSIIRYVWVLFTSFISLSIIWQYLMLLGAPPSWCQDFWFLVDNHHPPPAYKLVPECVLVLFAAKQMKNFIMEIRHSRRINYQYDGGNNNSIVRHFEELGHVNPVTDFTTYNTSYLDIFKTILFSVSYYGAMWVVFLGSVNRVNIFSIVYLCYVFVHLWYGLNLYYKPLPVILKYWNQLIAQNVTIILIKTLLQVMGCFYLYEIPLEHCAYVRLFGVGCVRRFETTDYFDILEKDLEICKPADSEMSGIEWDAAIFAFLIIQRRVFGSAEILGKYRQKELDAIKEEQKSVRERMALKIKKVYEHEKKIQGYTKTLYFFKFCYVAMDIGIVSATNTLENYNRIYVEVRATLDKEKRLLKETTDYQVGIRVAGWWLPRASYESLLTKSKLPRAKRPPKEMSMEEQPHIVKLIQALWLFAVSKSDLLAYFAIIMNQVMLSQLITIPLSMMVFFWGSLCNPRTSRTFWIVSIGYVELVILLKCIFQFYIMPGNGIENIKLNTKMDKENPLFPPVIFGLQQMDLYYIWDMHYLKTVGLWTAIRDTTKDVRSDGAYIMNKGTFEQIDGGTPSKQTVYTIKSTKSSILDNILKACGTIIMQYATGFRDFYQRMLYHHSQKAVDLYTLMFVCDVTTLMIVTMRAKDLPAVIMYYIARCLYLLISAYQIRYGYPSRIWGYFYAHSFTFWNLALMKIYMFIPFLYELRTALDWMLTDTSMVVFDWFKMEDMYMCIYEVKKQIIYKYLYGLGFVVLILLIVWFPIMTYSWGRAQGLSNPPKEAKLTFTLGKFEPIYSNATLSWEVTLLTDGKQKQVAGQLTKSFYPFTSGRKELLKMITFTRDEHTKEQKMRYFLPKFLRVQQTGETAMRWYGGTYLLTRTFWKTRKDGCGGRFGRNALTKTTSYFWNECLTMTATTLLSYIPSLIRWWHHGSILSIYGVYFFFLSGFIRDIIFNKVENLYATDAPYVERLYRTCIEHFTCREYGFANLESYHWKESVFFFTSKEMMTKVTRYKEDPYNSVFHCEELDSFG
nr:unnamed protein product [Callosobruchus chinensis]